MRRTLARTAFLACALVVAMHVPLTALEAREAAQWVNVTPQIPPVVRACLDDPSICAAIDQLMSARKHRFHSVIWQRLDGGDWVYVLFQRLDGKGPLRCVLAAVYVTPEGQAEVVIGPRTADAAVGADGSVQVQGEERR